MKTALNFFDIIFTRLTICLIVLVNKIENDDNLIQLDWSTFGLVLFI